MNCRRPVILSLFLVLCFAALVGCNSLKKASIVSGAGLASGAIASIVTSGTAPALLASSGSVFVTSAIIDQTLPNKKKGKSEPMNCAPTNFFDIIEALITQASWWLLLLVGIPMLLGWLIPGPLARIKKGRK